MRPIQDLLIYLSVSPNQIKHVILVDDDEDDRELFSAAIAQIAPHIHVDTFVNGRELIDFAKTNLSDIPDLIFLDVNMPLMDGIESLAALRELARFKTVPVIIYSTSDKEAYVKQAYGLGANLYIKKPDSFQETKKVLVRALDSLMHSTQNILFSSFVLRA